MPHKQSLKQTISVFVALNLILSQILYAVPVGKTTIGIDKQDKLLHNYETDDKSIISDQENNPNLTIDKTNNGVPLININKPNSKGTSHNIYKAYSVTNKGVILNNSNKITNTALAGQVMPNTNYSKNTKEASLIINEISGSDISKLQGITEIAGSKADIIISNPNGIYINGAGFINANNVRLTTNAPLEKSANNGKIEIDGLGLDLSNTNKSELIASVAKLNAPIYNANELEITLGSKE
ncbi:MAG: filamentous hemagglutinin N-terminal domain-containing protein, partial [Campylobacter sp.]|nr:filamentous hemagglutinin N-terminal domain-containing protein [Campylobacter sp.]